MLCKDLCQICICLKNDLWQKLKIIVSKRQDSKRFLNLSNTKSPAICYDLDLRLIKVYIFTFCFSKWSFQSLSFWKSSCLITILANQSTKSLFFCAIFLPTVCFPLFWPPHLKCTSKTSFLQPELLVAEILFLERLWFASFLVKLRK